MSRSGMGRDVHSAFPLPTTTSPTLQGALKDGFGEAAVVCDMPEPCKLPSLDHKHMQRPANPTSCCLHWNGYRHSVHFLR